MDWIDLPQDVERWQAAVNAVKKQRVPKIWGISGLPEELLASRTLPCVDFMFMVPCIIIYSMK